MPVLGPLVSYLQTPRNAQGALLESTLKQLIQNAVDAGVNAITVLGSAGGAAYMPRSMRKKVITLAVETVAGRVPVIVGVGALTTAEIALNLQEAADAGAHGALLQPMSYQPLLPHEVIYLYEQANATTKIPLWVYNNPATTRHNFTLEELAHIAALENVAGIKDRAANKPEIQHRKEFISAGLSAAKKQNFSWGFSGEIKGAMVLGAGEHSWHSALAGIMPAVCVELAQAAVVGREDNDIAAFAQQMQSALNPLTVTMTQYGGIRVAHAVAALKGLDVGSLPQPLRPLPPAVHGIVHLAVDSIEQSLRTLQERMQNGGVAATKNVILQNEAPTLTSPATPQNSTVHSSAPVTRRRLHRTEHLHASSEQAPSSNPKTKKPVPPVPPAPTTRAAVHATQKSSDSAQPVIATRSAARAVQQTADSQQVAQPHQTTELQQNTEVQLPQLTRVSAKARVQNELTRRELAQAADKILLTGNPDEDQTRLNIARIEEPILGTDTGDLINYVPRRAR